MLFMQKGRAFCEELSRREEARLFKSESYAPEGEEKMVGLVANDPAASGPAPVESESAIKFRARLRTPGGQFQDVLTTLDTGAEVTLVSQRLAVQYDLKKLDAQLPDLRWLQQQRTACYSAYELHMDLNDSRGIARSHTVMAYGVDQEDTDVLLGRHTMRRLGIDIQNGANTWRWGLKPQEIQTVSAKSLRDTLIRETDTRVLLVG